MNSLRNIKRSLSIFPCLLFLVLLIAILLLSMGPLNMKHCPVHVHLLSGVCVFGAEDGENGSEPPRASAHLGESTEFNGTDFANKMLGSSNSLLLKGNRI